MSRWTERRDKVRNAVSGFAADMKEDFQGVACKKPLFDLEQCQKDLEDANSKYSDANSQINNLYKEIRRLEKEITDLKLQQSSPESESSSSPYTEETNDRDATLAGQAPEDNQES